MSSRPGAKSVFFDQQSGRKRRHNSEKDISSPSSRPGISAIHRQSEKRKINHDISDVPAKKKKTKETIEVPEDPKSPILTQVPEDLIRKAHTTTAISGKAQTIIVGPWGGSGGNAWDHGSYTGIREIRLSHGDAIGSLNVVYDLNGEPFAGSIAQTGTNYFKNDKIELEFPDEFLVSVSGHTAPLSWLGTKTPVIRSLTFETNKRTFGPYGDEEGTPFNFPIENGLIVGFKGRSGELLNAIGFHLSL